MNNYAKNIGEIVKRINDETVQKVLAITELFSMLDIEPMEEFKIKISDGSITDYKQRITYDFYRQQFNEKTQCWETVENDVLLPALLAGACTIVKMPKFAEVEQKMIEVCKMLGYKYIAKDFNGEVWATKCKPYKCVDDFWECEDNDISNFELPSQLEFNYLNWSDKEPYYIGE